MDETDKAAEGAPTVVTPSATSSIESPASPDTTQTATEPEVQTDGSEVATKPSTSRLAGGKRHKKQRSTLAKVTEVPALILMAFVIAVVIKTFLVQAFYIPSESMLPTLRVGDRVLVEKVGYLFGDAGRGDVVVFEREAFGAVGQDLPWWDDVRNGFRELLGLPTGLEEDYIKRVVAVGGDVIRYVGSPRRLYVNGERQDISYVKGGRDRGSPAVTKDVCRRLKMETAGDGCRVPAGTVFVMGDNRGNSEDSRVIGPIDEDKIVGRAFLIIWPPGDFGGL